MFADTYTAKQYLLAKSRLHWFSVEDNQTTATTISFPHRMPVDTYQSSRQPEHGEGGIRLGSVVGCGMTGDFIQG